MKIALFTDLHGNLQALEAILKALDEEKVDRIICLGDVIGVGPKSNECVEILRNRPDIECIYGNHELYSTIHPNIGRKKWPDEFAHHTWVKSTLSPENLEYLKNLPLKIEDTYLGKKFLFVHFLLNDESAENPFYSLKILWDKRVNDLAKDIEADYTFVGHEHGDFEVDNQGKKLYDIGTCGCVHTDVTNYTLIEITDTINIETIYVKFDREGLKRDLEAYEYPRRNFVANNFFGFEEFKYEGWA